MSVKYAMVEPANQTDTEKVWLAAASTTGVETLRRLCLRGVLPVPAEGGNGRAARAQPVPRLRSQLRLRVHPLPGGHPTRVRGGHGRVGVANQTTRVLRPAYQFGWGRRGADGGGNRDPRVRLSPGSRGTACVWCTCPGQTPRGSGGLGNYLKAKLLWDPQADIAALARDYLARTYGHVRAGRRCGHGRAARGPRRGHGPPLQGRSGRGGAGWRWTWADSSS